MTLPDAVYVLHAFQKRSTRGIKTAQRDIEMIRRRLSRAMDISRDRLLEQEKRDEQR